MWQESCSEDTIYDAAYAAAPYLVACAEQASRADALEYLIVLGLIETYAVEIPQDLQAAYGRALTHAQALALKRLADCPIDHRLRYMLAAVAAFRGRVDLADTLANVDAIQEPCSSCGTVVFPSELQRVVVLDQEAASA